MVNFGCWPGPMRTPPSQAAPTGAIDEGVPRTHRKLASDANNPRSKRQLVFPVE